LHLANYKGTHLSCSGADRVDADDRPRSRAGTRWRRPLATGAASLSAWPPVARHAGAQNTTQQTTTQPTPPPCQSSSPFGHQNPENCSAVRSKQRKPCQHV